MRIDLNNQSGLSEKNLSEFAKDSKWGVYKIVFDKSSSLYSEDPVCNHYTVCRAETIINQALKTELQVDERMIFSLLCMYPHSIDLKLPSGSRVEFNWFDKESHIDIYVVQIDTFISYLEAHINEKAT